MFTITIFNHVTKSKGQKFEFETKRKANAFIKSNKNIKKIGYDFYDVNDLSIEYILNY